MRLTRTKAAKEFGDVTDTLYWFGGNHPANHGGFDADYNASKKGEVTENRWMQQHPDLLGEFQVFMKAFLAEVEQRFEEE